MPFTNNLKFLEKIEIFHFFYIFTLTEKYNNVEKILNIFLFMII